MNLHITRRQFLRYCMVSGAALGLSQTDLLRLEKALATPQTCSGSPTPSVIWMTGQACSGCQTSLLNRVMDVSGNYYDYDWLRRIYGDDPTLPPFPASCPHPDDPIPELNFVADVADLLVGDALGALVPPRSAWRCYPNNPTSVPWADDADPAVPGTNAFPGGYITLEWLTTVNAGAGDINVQHIKSIVNSNNFYLLLDGSIPTVDENFCLVFDNEVNDGVGGTPIIGSLPTGPTTLSDALRWMVPHAVACIAVGTCSSFGGVPSGKKNKTGAVGLQQFLINEGISKPVINVAGCPPHPDWIVHPVAYILTHGGAIPPLDSKGRPAATFGEVPLCLKCANHPSMGASYAAFLGDDGCQGNMGCKGPITFGDCPLRQKNVFDDGTKNNWCSAGSRGPNIAQARHVCQSCIEPDFPDPPASPFYEPATTD